MEILLRVLAEMAPAAGWIAAFVAAVVATFVLYVGVAMAATLLTRDQKRVQIQYRVFSDLLRLFRRGRQ
ncbi:hypothetical protein [Nonomuraea longicatena]|uniref:Uncharacterized protein n=1 Tax=Nonomuraea longicatena TaxID=83682 RepID=A0ABP4AP41_9ACTN